MRDAVKTVPRVPMVVAAGRKVRANLVEVGRRLGESWPALAWAYRDWQRYGRISTPLSQRRPGVCFVPVIGMHRSGTSCVTGILARNGLRLSEDLIEPNRFNPEGFWESQEVLSINEDLLSAFDCKYENPDGVVTRFPRRLLRRAERYLLRLADRPVVGWKDPRMTITWPAWQELLYKTPHVAVACFRHPRNTVKSFVAAEAQDSGLTYEVGLECWRKYNAVVAAMPSRLVLINFDEPLEPQIRCACRAIGLDFDPASMSLFKKSLVHNNHREESSGSDEVDALYDYLLARWRAQPVGAAPEPRGAASSVTT